MPRATCIEDGFEYRVGRIMAELRKEYEEMDSVFSFQDWLYENTEVVGKAFLDDVETYMGLPE